MGAVTPPPHERLAVDVVLQSGIFDKAPRLGNFFRYICERHLEGDGDQIKEYSIALEALGRPVDFDPKKDSIVRVEAHRLRRRLQAYYRGPGACQPIQIVIPNGQYRPQFVSKKEPERPAAAHKDDERTGTSFDEASLFAPVLIGTPTRRKHAAVLWMVLAPFLLVAVSGAVFLLRGLNKPAPHLPLLSKAVVPADDVWKGNSTDPIPAEFRMLAGYHGAPFSDLQGHIWNADAYYSGGAAAPVPPDRHIEYQPDPNLSRRGGAGGFVTAFR